MDEHLKDLDHFVGEVSEGPEKEEIRSARDLISHLSKTAKTLRIYLPNNPIYQRFLKEVTERFQGHLAAYGESRFKVKQYDLHYKGSVVYENTNRLESLAFRLYVDGIREVRFLDGLQHDEITVFLEILGRESDSKGSDDDLVTLLWERHFAHITYLVAEDFIQEASATPAMAEQGSPAEIVQKEKPGAEPLTAEQHLGPQYVSETGEPIFALNETEIEEMKREIQSEEKMDLSFVLIRIVTAIIRVEREIETFSEMVDLLDDVGGTMTAQGDLMHARMIVQFYREMLEPGRDLPMPFREVIDRSLDRSGDPKILMALEPILNQDDGREADHLYEFLVLLKPSVADSVANLMASITQSRNRKALCNALSRLCSENWQPLLRRLSDRRWFVVRNILFVMGQIADPKMIEPLRPMVKHAEVRVRKELVRTLAAFKGPTASALLLELLHDSDSQIRIAAARSLTPSSNEQAAEEIFSIIRTKDFRSRTQEEKQEYFEAFGRVGGNSVLPVLRKMLRAGARAWINRAAKEKIGLCALAGLRSVGTNEADQVMKEGLTGRSRAIRLACEESMNRVGARKQNG